MNEHGGVGKVNQTKKWAFIAKTIGFKSQSGPNLKQIYVKWLHPYEQSVKRQKEYEKKNVKKGVDEAEVIILDDDEDEEAEESGEQQSTSMQGQGRIRDSRMMAGVKHNKMPTLGNQKFF